MVIDNRRTGRTTRMLTDCVEKAWTQGAAIVVVAANRSHIHHMMAQCVRIADANMPKVAVMLVHSRCEVRPVNGRGSIRFITADNPSLDIRNGRLLGVEDPLVIDHYTWEYLNAKFERDMEDNARKGRA